MGTFCKSSISVVLAQLFILGIGAAYGASRFPEKPIALVVHASAGGNADTFSRVIAAGIAKHKLLPQPIVVENKTGGSGAVAMAYVAGKKKDPYYLMAVTPVFIATPLQGLSPITYKDFTPIANFWFDENILMLNANSKYKSIWDVVADAKANPEKVTIGGPQVGSSDSMCVYQIEKAAGIKVKYVAFGGGGETLAALLGGHVDLILANIVEAQDLLKANKIRILGVLAEKRLVGAPDIPTVMEQGINVLGIRNNRGLCAPGGIPEDARNVLQEAVFKFTMTEDFKKFTKDNMLTETWMDGPTFGQWLVQENERVAVMLKEMGLIKK